MTSVRPAIAVLALAAVGCLGRLAVGPAAAAGSGRAGWRSSRRRARRRSCAVWWLRRPRVRPEAPSTSASGSRLVDELSRLALAPSLEQGVACSPDGSCAQLTNVVAELPGTLPGPAVLLAAHYDSVAAVLG